MRIEFLGGAGTVTGSKSLVSSGTTEILVDCGLFQGIKSLRKRNWAPFDSEVAARLDAVVLTHAHIDHSGYQPVLVRSGFRGPIFVTPPTRDLVEILLKDSARLQEEEAYYRNLKRTTRHDPAQPLYTVAEVETLLPQLEPVPFGTDWKVGDFELRYHVAGHILGAASVTIAAADQTLLFSGDLGRFDDPLMPAPTPPKACDLVVMESTYGDREHPEESGSHALAAVMRRTFARGGILLLSAFAVGRAQLLLYTLDRVFADGLAPRVPVYLDSPMATDVTGLYLKYPSYHRLSRSECAQVCRVAEFLKTRDDSKSLNGKPGPFVVVSASGMLSGGRITHHLRHLVGHPEHTVALPGFQAPGTRGADLLAGAPSIKIHGERYRARAEVVGLDLFSAHADQRELLDWLGQISEPPEAVFLNHGEPHAADRLRLAIQDQFQLRVRAAEFGEIIDSTDPT